jgi:hypothetical protein
VADDEDEDPGFDEEEMLAMEEEMADEAGQEDGPAPPDEEVAACLTKTQFAACAKQWTRQAPRPLDPATDEVTFQQSEVCRRRCPRPTFTTAALTTSTVTTASVATTTLTATLTATLNQHHPNHHYLTATALSGSTLATTSFATSTVAPLVRRRFHHPSPPRPASHRWITRSTASSLS